MTKFIPAKFYFAIFLLKYCKSKCYKLDDYLYSKAIWYFNSFLFLYIAKVAKSNTREKCKYHKVEKLSTLKI